MVDYREILRLDILGYTKKYIASSVHSSRNTVSEVLTLAENLQALSFASNTDNNCFKQFTVYNSSQNVSLPDRSHIYPTGFEYLFNNPATQDTTAIGISCAKARNITYFITFENLINQLKAAHHENRLESRLKFFAKYKVLIIDEIGYMPIDLDSANLFFQLIARRYEKNSTIKTTILHSQDGVRYSDQQHWLMLF